MIPEPFSYLLIHKDSFAQTSLDPTRQQPVEKALIISLQQLLSQKGNQLLRF